MWYFLFPRESKQLNLVAKKELKQIEMEIEDRHVIECLELYVLSSGSTSSSTSALNNSLGSSNGSSVHGVLLEGLNNALSTIETNCWVPRSNQAKGLHEAGKALASIYSAVQARNWVESLNVLNQISTKCGRDHWSSMVSFYPKVNPRTSSSGSIHHVHQAHVDVFLLFFS